MLNVWVKNVKKLVNTAGIYCGSLYTYLIQSRVIGKKSVSKQVLIRPIILSFTTRVSTVNLSIFNLLDDFYTRNPQSLLLTKRIKI
jgi:hypothetical protein